MVENENQLGHVLWSCGQSLIRKHPEQTAVEQSVAWGCGVRVWRAGWGPHCYCVPDLTARFHCRDAKNVVNEEERFPNVQ